MDFAGPVEEHMFLVVVSAHTKWTEVFKMFSFSATQIIEDLCTLFSHLRLPLQLVSDNGPQFCLEEFWKFLVSHNIQPVCSAHFHPAPNGLAKCFCTNSKA